MNYRTLTLLISMLLITSCSGGLPELDTNKQLSYQFEQPKRQVFPSEQAVQLGKPTINDIGKTNRQHYYSANGNICKRLSIRKTACYIGNKWYESTVIMAAGG